MSPIDKKELGMHNILQINRDELREELHNVVNEILSQAQVIADRKAKDRLLTQEETCEMLKVCAVTLWRWQKTDYLTPVYVGGKKRYRLSDINQIIEKGGD